MNFLISSIFLLSLLGVFGRINLAVNFSMYFFEPLLLIFILLIFLKSSTKLKKHLFPIFLPGFVFVFWLGLTTLLKFEKNFTLIGLGYVFRLFFYLFVFYSFSLFFLARKQRIIFFKKKISYFFAIVVSVFLLQYIFFPDLRPLKYIGWDPHYKRLVGPFLDAYLAASLLGILSLLSYRLNRKILSFFLFILLVLTNSRAGIVSFLFAFFVSFYKDRFVREVFFLFILLAFFLFSLNPGIGGKIFRVETVRSRLEDYKVGIKFFLKSPIVGNGYGELVKFREIRKKTLPYIKAKYNAAGSFHSPYLTILGSGGTIAFLLFLIWVKKIFVYFPYKEFYIFVGSFSFFDNVLLHPLILLYLAFVLPFLRASGDG